MGFLKYWKRHRTECRFVWRVLLVHFGPPNITHLCTCWIGVLLFVLVFSTSIPAAQTCSGEDIHLQPTTKLGTILSLNFWFNHLTKHLHLPRTPSTSTTKRENLAALLLLFCSIWAEFPKLPVVPFKVFRSGWKCRIWQELEPNGAY